MTFNFFGTYHFTLSSLLWGVLIKVVCLLRTARQTGKMALKEVEVFNCETSVDCLGSDQ